MMPTRKRAVLSGQVCEIFSFDEATVTRIKKQVAAATGLSRIFKVLGDETRAKIVYALAQADQLCVCDIAQIVGLSLPAVSHHLRVLRELDIARACKEGKMVFYSLADDHVAALVRQGAEHASENHRSDRAGRSVRSMKRIKQ
jgi:ArsR family transcriptional regulator, lead/cadmium/zinc/bismuth-responsive transcriptional repressor